MTMTVLLVAARPQVNFGAAGNAEESPSSSLSSTDGTADADKVVDLRHYYNHHHHHHHGGGGGGYYNSYPYYNNYGYGGYGGYHGR